MKSQAERSYRWLFWALVVLGFLVDQGSKYAVFGWLYNNGQGGYFPVVGGTREPEMIFGLKTVFKAERDAGTDLVSPLRTWTGGDVRPEVNTGALWGRGQGKNVLFLAISLAAAVGIAYWGLRPGPLPDWRLCVALGLILAGTLGNLYDRVVFDGVRDFVQWSYLYLFPTFNLADSCLVCGAALLLWQALGTRPDNPADVAAEAAATVNGQAEPAAQESATACNR